MFSALGDRGHRRSGLLLLLDAVKEDRRAVLRSDVGTLAVERRRIVTIPKQVEQAIVVDDGRVELNPHGLGVAGRTGANLLVGWVLDSAAGVADRRCADPFELTKGGFDTPKTAGGERGLLHCEGPRRSDVSLCFKRRAARVQTRWGRVAACRTADLSYNEASGAGALSAPVAQGIEHWFPKPGVGGSIPPGGARRGPLCDEGGRDDGHDQRADDQLAGGAN